MVTAAEYRDILAREVDHRCKEKRMVQNPYRAPETIPGVESTQVRALLDIMAERLYALECSVQKFKKRKTL